MFDAEPLTERCRAILPTARHLCIGVSPFNSYFSTGRLTDLAGWALSEFEQCHFFVPDLAAAHTLQALGYPFDRAQYKARRQGQYVHNKVATALTACGVAQPEKLVWGLERLAGNARYAELLEHAHARFAHDAAFRAACLDASHWVIDHRLPPGTRATNDQLMLAVRYFLAELPLFADSAGIFGHPGPSMFVYHHRVDFLERFYRRELSWSPVAGQGFLVVSERATAAAAPPAPSAPAQGRR